LTFRETKPRNLVRKQPYKVKRQVFIYYNKVNANCQVCIGGGGGAIIIAVEQRLREVLSRRHKRRITGANLVTSAVLVPIYYKKGQYYILFTKRTERVKEHKGQISFPGGATHKRDSTLVDTALRESAEEIGLDPGKVKVLGELDDTLTETSNYVISPFVALIPHPYQFKFEVREVEEIIEAPISVLLDKECLRQETMVLKGKTLKLYVYNYHGRIIWGATAQILHQFLDVFSRALGGLRLTTPES
jgi:8-oxo-dGTP pyrophosphatase MutT (NUDIX family)